VVDLLIGGVAVRSGVSRKALRLYKSQGILSGRTLAREVPKATDIDAVFADHLRNGPFPPICKMSC
jgi:hypothetical protein